MCICGVCHQIFYPSFVLCNHIKNVRFPFFTVGRNRQWSVDRSYQVACGAKRCQIKNSLCQDTKNGIYSKPLQKLQIIIAIIKASLYQLVSILMRKVEGEKWQVGRSKEKKNKGSKGEESQSSLSDKEDTDKVMEVEYRKGEKSKEKNTNGREDEIQSSSLNAADIDDNVEEEKGEEVKGKDNKVMKERSKTSESSSPSDSEDKRSATRHNKGNKTKTAKVTTKISKVQTCSLCKVQVTHLRRHVVAHHVNKGERLAVSQLESILQAAIHWEEKRGKRWKEKRLRKKVSFKGRVWEKSALCDKAVLAMTMHLQCTHKLKKDDSIYKNAMKMHRPYEGKT